MLTAEANELTTKEGKSTINESHLLEALKSLGFERYAEACQSLNGAQARAARSISPRSARDRERTE